MMRLTRPRSPILDADLTRGSTYHVRARWFNRSTRTDHTVNASGILIRDMRPIALFFRFGSTGALTGLSPDEISHLAPIEPAPAA